MRAAGVHATLIDFSLSRIRTDAGHVAFFDLASDPELFQGPKGDVQVGLLPDSPHLCSSGVCKGDMRVLWVFCLVSAIDPQLFPWPRDGVQVTTEEVQRSADLLCPLQQNIEVPPLLQSDFSVP